MRNFSIAMSLLLSTILLLNPSIPPISLQKEGIIDLQSYSLQFTQKQQQRQN